MERSGRLHLVDALRFVSLLVVLGVHLASAGIVALPAEGVSRDLWLNFARNGSYGVTLFFVISGFVITRTCLSRATSLQTVSVKDFYIRRFARIVPALTVSVLIGATLMALADGSTAREAFSIRHPKAAFDLPFWLSIPTFSFNWLLIAREPLSPGFGLHWDVLWSLAIEEQFYITYPWLLRVCGTDTRVQRSLWVFVVLGPIARATATALRPGSFLATFTNSFAGFEQIALGALTCFAVRRAASRPLLGSAARGVLTALCLVGMIFAYWKTTLAYEADRVYGPSCIGFLAACALYFGVQNVGSRWPGAWGLLTVPGQWSYGGYLCHALVLFGLWPVLRGMTAWNAFALYATTVFTVAWISFRLFEAPVGRFLMARLSR